MERDVRTVCNISCILYQSSAVNDLKLLWKIISIVSRHAAACRQSPLNPVLCHQAWAKFFLMPWSLSPSPLHDMSTDNSPVCPSLPVRVRVCVYRISSPVLLGLNYILAHKVWLGPAQPGSGQGNSASLGPLCTVKSPLLPKQPSSNLDMKETKAQRPWTLGKRLLFYLKHTQQ